MLEPQEYLVPHERFWNVNNQTKTRAILGRQETAFGNEDKKHLGQNPLQSSAISSSPPRLSLSGSPLAG